MSEAKHKKSMGKLPAKISKVPPVQSATKLKQRSQFANVKPAQGQTISRNLMVDFKSPSQQRIQIQQQKSIQSVEFSSQTPIIQSVYHSNDSHVSSETAKSAIQLLVPQEKQNQYGFQLPKSYIFALSGLQQGIKARDVEIRKLKKYLKDQTTIHENCDAEIQEGHQRQAQFQDKISQLNMDAKFLRETLTDLKSQNTQIIKQKILLENQLQNLKEQSHKKSLEYENQMKSKINQLKEASVLILDLKDNLKIKDCQLDNRKKEMSEALLKEGEQRAKAKSQISILKQEIVMLSDKVVFQQMKDKEQVLLNEKNKLDALEAELVINREILKQITAEGNTEPRFRSQTCSKEAYNHEDRATKNIPRLPISSATKMQQRPSMNERSSNRARMYRQPPTTTDRNKNLISQYRELMRHQKQLISFNYQMQQLQKSMISQKDQIHRQQIQRNYARLKRQIQKKQMVVAELKAFLNDPTNKGIN